MLDAAVLARDNEASGIDDLPGGFDAKVEGFFGRQSPSRLRQHQASRRRQRVAIPGQNMDRGFVVGVAFEAARHVFRLAPAVRDDGLITQAIGRLALGGGLSDAKRDRRDPVDGAASEIVNLGERDLGGGKPIHPLDQALVRRKTSPLHTYQIGAANAPAPAEISSKGCALKITPAGVRKYNTASARPR